MCAVLQGEERGGRMNTSFRIEGPDRVSVHAKGMQLHYLSLYLVSDF